MILKDFYNSRLNFLLANFILIFYTFLFEKLILLSYRVICLLFLIPDK